MRLPTAIASTALVSAFTLALATPAFAAGTVHYNNPEVCYDSGSGYVVCYSSSGQYNVADTPSGNQSLTGKGTSSFSIQGPGYNYSDTYDYKYHFLSKPGELHEESFKSSGTFSLNGSTCTFTDHAHYANGKWQYDRPEVTCS